MCLSRIGCPSLSAHLVSLDDARVPVFQSVPRLVHFRLHFRSEVIEPVELLACIPIILSSDEIRSDKTHSKYLDAGPQDFLEWS